MMPIRFAAPEWFLLAPLLALAVWRWRAVRSPLRLACLALLLLFLVRPQVRRVSRGLDLWVLADRSASAATSVEPHLAEWEKILDRSKGADDRLFFVDYAAEAALRDVTAGVELIGGREATRTAFAARYALSQMAGDRAARLLVLTDGYATEPVNDLPERLLRQGVALDYRLATEGNVRDFRVDSFLAPPRAQPGEPFLVELRVSGPNSLNSERVPYEISRDGQSLSRGSLEVSHGRGIARFTDRVTAPGGHHYTVRIAAEGDVHPGNDGAERWMEIAGGPRVLLVSEYTGDPLAEVLRAQGFEVEVAANPQALDAGRLQGARAVILNNVPAFRLPHPFLEALDFFVRDQGGGLLMAGGKASFACGGYFGSPIADLLPVSMELRQEQRKLATAMAIVLDRSGSMSMPAGGGKKIDLADAGAARAVELLGPMDEVAVFAVDTEPHEVVPLSTVGGDAEKLGSTIRRITSAGGGIYVYTGLNAAYEALKKSPAGQRHVILFADAADAVQPGDYKNLLATMGKEGMTVSAIGLGTERDKDANFLKDIAARGNGRSFFTADASELPGLFEQETVAVARSAFLDQETKLKPLGGWAALAARPLHWPGAVDGYNLSYLRDGARAAAVTGDTDAAPLVAFWQRGVGRTAAVSFPLGGEFSARVRAWPEFGDFAQTMTRWLMGESVPPGLGLRAEVEGTALSAELLFDATWEQRLAQNAPRLVLAGTGAGTAEPLVWERMEPGRYRASASLTPGQIVRGAVQIGKTILPLGPLQAGSGAEWELDPARPAQLAAVARASGGVERVDLSTVWSAPRRAEFDDVRRWILPGLLLLFLAEALLFRIGRGSWKSEKELGGPMLKKVAVPARKSKEEPPASRQAPPPPPAAPVPEITASRRERFRRAKRGE